MGRGRQIHKPWRADCVRNKRAPCSRRGRIRPGTDFARRQSWRFSARSHPARAQRKLQRCPAAGHKPCGECHCDGCRRATHEFAAASTHPARTPTGRRFVGWGNYWNYRRCPHRPLHSFTQHPVLASVFPSLRRARGRLRRRWIRWRRRVWRRRRIRRLWRRQFWWRRGKQQLVASEGAMVPEDTIREFVTRIRGAAGPNLESVIFFGSAVSGDFHPGLSNLNLFCVLRDCSFAALQALAPVTKWWDQQKQPPPLCMTCKELERSTDVFTIELLDMQQHHRVLFGEDVVQGLRISLHVHRVQVEYELREKLILLRQQVLLASGNNSRLWDLLLRAVPSFGTLFRHALIALGNSSQPRRREAVEVLAKQVGFDPSAIQQTLDVREHKTDRKKIDINELAARYLAAIEKVTAAVDEALDSDASVQV